MNNSKINLKKTKKYLKNININVKIQTRKSTRRRRLWNSSQRHQSKNWPSCSNQTDEEEIPNLGGMLIPKLSESFKKIASSEYHWSARTGQT